MTELTKESVTNLSEPLVRELDYESISTRKALERVPFDKFDWKPHEKSMTLGQLASHIADIPWWINVIINQDSFDPEAEGYAPFAADSTETLVKSFDEKIVAAKEILGGASNETLHANWKMIAGGAVFLEMPRIAVVRTWVLNHMIHHRGQLTVYIRENDIAVPVIYANSADESAVGAP